MLTIFAGLAQFERECLLQRQAEGIAEAKARGVYKGREPVEVDDAEYRRKCEQWQADKQTARATMEKLGLKPNTFYRRAKAAGYCKAAEAGK